MPLIRFKPAPELDTPKVIATLAEEFIRPRDEPNRPLISVDKSRARYHIAVIWNGWGSLSQAERSDLIMRAYEQAFGNEDALNVSSAMGLSADEAQRLGLAFDLVPT